MYYSEDIIEEVRARNDIVDVIDNYTHLKKRGNTYTACCPFHQEKTPSFHVSRDKQMYHCFGCGVGGNVFTFVMEYENFTFQEAIKLLAERAGMELPQREMSEAERKKADYKSTLLEMNKSAAAYFHYLLKNKQGEKGYAYLKNRGITDETIKKFGLGYSDIYRDDLYQYLRKKGFSDEQLKDSSLVYIDEAKGANDKFWNRVMYPILDVNNRVIGFGGRVMGEGEPKYLNSNETPVFDKSRNLYGLHLARKSKRRGIILCEGYMDVISMHQAGFDNAVASLGTAFTPGQANLLKRYTTDIYLAYDSDGAGVKAALRAIGILGEFDFSVRIINMEPYKDPDEFIQNLGVEAYEERIKSAISGIMFQIKILAGQYDQNDPESRTKFQHEAAKILAGIEDPLERNNYLEAVSNTYYIDKKALEIIVNQYGSRMLKEKVSIPETERRQDRNQQKEEQKNTPQKLLLTWLVNEPVLFDKLDGIVGADDFYEPLYHQVALLLFQQYKETKSVMPASILNQFEDVEAQKKVAELFQTTLKFEPLPEDNNRAITDVVRKVKLNSIEYEIAQTKDISRLQVLIQEKAQVLKLHISV